MITILVAASSPLDKGQLHLGKEHKLIKHSLDSSKNREQFRVVGCMATTPDDLRVYLLEHSPTLVHFCGHGAGTSGLCFEDSEGNTRLVSGASLARLFHIVNDDVKCVVLNACYSDEQAKQISEHIDFVVGMRDTVNDLAALKFAEGFYQALWAGQSYERAFKFGCSAIDTAGLPDEHVPIILHSPRLGGGSLPYNEALQQHENFLLRYLNTPYDERFPLTLEGANIAPLMQAYYRGQPFARWSSVTALASERISDLDVVIFAQARGRRKGREHLYYLRQDGDTLRIHWKATVGYWEVPAKTLYSLGAPEPVTARAIAQISDYYNYGYEFDQYISVEIQDLEAEQIHAYLHRGHPQSAKLVDLLQDGQPHRIMVTLRPDPPGRRQAEIIELVSDSWIASSEPG